ncbi:MAG: ABC transporter substrate-binding protein [Sphingomonadales bacterium]|nr:ABC transporter substrate-binding protein [Sphingomonadales bacterium]
MTDRLTIGFVPLVDAALPILSHVLGYAEEEGLALDFVKDASWATVLDRLLYGHTDAAHLIAPLAVATALGRGRPARMMAAPFVLGLNGNAITISTALAARLDLGPGLVDPTDAGRQLKAEIARRGPDRKLRFAVVHRHSSHNNMLRYWLARCGIAPGRDIDIVTIAPPFAADALASGEVDGICVGEPWNSIAVENGAGRVLIATAQIWRRGVEKVLALPADTLQNKRAAIEKLIRAMIRAGAHFIDPANRESVAAILAEPQWIGGSAEIIGRAIADEIRIIPGGPLQLYPDFMFQHRDAANFPWISQAMWLYTQLARWEDMPLSDADAAIASAVFRPDIYRQALTGTGAPLPGASSKVEGSLANALPVGAAQGAMTLGADQFFDGLAFDPDDLAGYMRLLPKA